MKTIIPNKDGYAVTEWVEKPKQLNQVPIDGSEYTILYEGWKQQLASLPSTLVHPDYQNWAKENLYQPVEDDRIETGWYLMCKKGTTNCTCTNGIESGQCDNKIGLEFCAVPKQPVEVKEGQIQYENGEWSRDVYPEPEAALPVEKEVSLSQVIAKLKAKKAEYDKCMEDTRKGGNDETIIRMCFNRSDTYRYVIELLSELPTTAAPSEDWVSVMQNAHDYAEKEGEGMYTLSEYRENILNYLSQSFYLTRKKKD